MITWSQCSGSVGILHGCGSGYSDPFLKITDPALDQDPTLISQVTKKTGYKIM
jgi:hypothetical protein